jgi:hypothetical protein
VEYSYLLPHLLLVAAQDWVPALLEIQVASHDCGCVVCGLVWLMCGVWCLVRESEAGRPHPNTGPC